MSEQVQLDKKKSMKEEKIRAFMKNKLAVAGAVLLLTMIVLAALSPIIAPYGFDEQNYEIARQTPSLQHLAGTDELGRDIFSRILYGGRVSLTIGIISVGIGLIFGGSLGVIAAYYGGVTETVIMRVIDVLMAIPSIILSISICAALGSGIVNTMIAVGISSIPTYARVFRSSVISEKSKEYIEAARAVAEFHWSGNPAAEPGMGRIAFQRTSVYQRFPAHGGLSRYCDHADSTCPQPDWRWSA